MDNANDRQLSFPQRNWFLICLLVAIISPLVVHLLQRGADKESYRESSHIKPVDAANATDTSYKVASPAGAADTSKKGGAAGAAGSSGAGGTAGPSGGAGGSGTGK